MTEGQAQAPAPAPVELGGGFQQYQDRLEQQREKYATRWLYSPLIKVPVQSFPHLQIRAGFVTPLSGEHLGQHYGLKDIDAEVIAASGGLIQPTSNGRNYFSYTAPDDVASLIVMENTVAGVIELPALRGVPASEAPRINRALFGDVWQPAQPRIERLRGLTRREGLTDQIYQTAEQIIVSTDAVYREALNTTKRARLRLEKGGDAYDTYEFLCFDFTGEPLTNNERQGIPPPAAENPAIGVVLEQNAKLQEQLLAIQADNAKTNARLVELFAKLAGEEPAAKDTKGKKS